MRLTHIFNSLIKNRGPVLNMSLEVKISWFFGHNGNFEKKIQSTFDGFLEHARLFLSIPEKRKQNCQKFFFFQKSKLVDAMKSYTY